MTSTERMEPCPGPSNSSARYLHHLPETEKVMKRMASALRPGGWLLVEEDDWGSVLPAGVTNPSTAPFEAAMKAALDALRKQGLADC